MSNEDVKGFHWADYVVFCLMLGMSFFVGVYQRFTGDRQRSTGEYLLGNRQLNVIPTTVSMFMSYISAILVLGSSAEMYMFGTQQWAGLLGSFAAYVFTVVLYVPLIWSLKITSNYEYHEMRFRSRVVRLSNTALDICSTVMYMGLAMFAPSTALEAVTGFPVWASILCTGGLATIYTTMGGMKAVVWTDFFQSFVLMGGLVTILVVGAINVGGLSKVWEISKEGGRIIFFDFNPDPTIRMTFWTATLGNFFTTITTAASTQNHIQRYIALPTLRHARMAILLQIPCLFCVYLLVNLTGLTVYAYYAEQGCDPLRGGIISSSNQLLPYFVVDVLGYPGLPGLFVAVLFSGALSSVSSSMTALSAITWKDILEPYFMKASELRRSLVTKILVFVFGFLGVGMAFLFRILTGHVMQLSSSILGGIGGPMAGVIFAGTLLPWVQWKGILAGMVSGLFMTSWINVGQQLYEPWVEHLETDVSNCTFIGNTTASPMPENPEAVFGLYRLSFYYIGTVGWATTIVVSLIVSFATGPEKPGELDPRTVVNFPDRGLCNCVQSAHRDKCYCGVNYDQTEDKEDIKKEEPDDQSIDRGENDKTTSDKASPMQLLSNGHVNGHVNAAFKADTDMSTQL